jgi:hypothetical protein
LGPICEFLLNLYSFAELDICFGMGQLESVFFEEIGEDFEGFEFFYYNLKKLPFA